ncbi:protein HGV2-like isoform X2 [Scylla paramamosain]|uniref:protein HGV2-like isoform X2 n=1 Tax=Scylla paramamosain TaxID=85552 RepID=UPI003082A846
MASTTPSTKAQADSTTTQPPTTDEKVHAASAAFNHFSQGKRHLLVGDFKSAVTAFKEATESLVELYGEQAPECGDAYYHYGRALLELARKEAGVLGPDLDGASSQEGSTGEEEDEEEESEESQEEEEGGKKEEGEEEEEEEEDGEGKEKDKKEGNAAEGEGENTEEEEEVTTLQCAWEWLDVARVIFDKQEETPEVVKKRAQIRLSLGEVCMESEDYEGAINEFKQCLQMQESVLEKDDRSLAETHYQLGLVYSLSDNFDSAVSHFTAAVDVIHLKIKNLQARVTEKNSWSKERRDKDLAESKDVFYTEEGEIEDLQQLLPDIQLKIVDMKEMKAASVEKLQQAAKPGDIAAMLLGKGEGPRSSGAVFSQAREGEASGSAASSSKSSDAKPLICQVRRKRKPEEDEATDEQKKPRLENGVKSDRTEEQEEDKSKAVNSSMAKPIAIKRKVAQNGKDSSPESSSNKAESSSTTSESSSNSAESLLAPQEIK